MFLAGTEAQGGGAGGAGVSGLRAPRGPAASRAPSPVPSQGAGRGEQVPSTAQASLWAGQKVGGHSPAGFPTDFSFKAKRRGWFPPVPPSPQEPPTTGQRAWAAPTRSPPATGPGFPSRRGAAPRRPGEGLAAPPKFPARVACLSLQAVSSWVTLSTCRSRNGAGGLRSLSPCPPTAEARGAWEDPLPAAARAPGAGAHLQTTRLPCGELLSPGSCTRSSVLTKVKPRCCSSAEHKSWLKCHWAWGPWMTQVSSEEPRAPAGGCQRERPPIQREESLSPSWEQGL